MAKAASQPKNSSKLSAIESAREGAFEDFLKAMSREKPGEVLRLDDETVDRSIPSISTGAISLDVALGIGGLPRGRIIEFYGPEMSGKTSLALAVAACAQREGGKVGFVDAEHALSPQHALDMGIDPHEMVIYQPSSGEDGLSMVDKMCRSKAFDVVIIDSVAALTPQVELDGEMADMVVGAHARLMSKGMRKLTGVSSETGTMLIFINQLREKIGGYGNPEVTTGGKALKFYASVRIEIRSAMGKVIKDGTTAVGQTCVAKVSKNKVAPPHRVAEYDLMFGKGIQAAGSLLDVGEALGIVTRNGASYFEVLTGDRIGVGKDKCKAVLEADPELQERLTAAVYAHMRGELTLAPAASDADEEMDADLAEALKGEDIDLSRPDDDVAVA